MHCVHLGLVQWANGSTIHLLNDYNVFSCLVALECYENFQIGFQYIRLVWSVSEPLRRWELERTSGINDEGVQQMVPIPKNKDRDQTCLLSLTRSCFGTWVVQSKGVPPTLDLHSPDQALSASYLQCSPHCETG